MCRDRGREIPDHETIFPWAPPEFVKPKRHRRAGKCVRAAKERERAKERAGAEKRRAKVYERKAEEDRRRRWNVNRGRGDRF